MNWRNFLALTGGSGSLLLAACGRPDWRKAASPPPIKEEPPPPPVPDEPLSPPSLPEELPHPAPALRDWLRTHASPFFALPEALAVAPQVSWAGALGKGSVAATTLPDGVIHAAASPLIGGPIRSRFKATLPANPMVGGFPCLVADGPYMCKGQQRSTRSRTVLRIRTDAPRIELSGVVADGSHTVQTLIVDGRLAPPVTLTSSRGGGGWLAGTVVIDFGERALRDIWIDTGLHVAYVKVGPRDVLLAAEDGNEPQMSVIGDSFLQMRSNAFGNGGAIGLEVAARLGIRRVAIDAIGGSGYYCTGADLGSLNDRLPVHVEDDSMLYLVMAGLNDYPDFTGDPPGAQWPARAAYEESVYGYLRNLRAARPQAVIVVTAPFCPVPPQSDSTYVAHPDTNSSGRGDFLYKAQLHQEALQRIEGPWVYVDVLMGTGWRNSAGATGDVTGLQWFTGGTAAPGTSATYKPGNALGGGGGGFGGIRLVPVLGAGTYTQGPDVVASGGSGHGLQLASTIDASGRLAAIRIVQPGVGYGQGDGLPRIIIDPTYQTSPAMLGTPLLIEGINPDGSYPLPEFAPPDAVELNNIYRMLLGDKVHPSPLGVEYLSTRLAQNIHQAVMAL